MIGWKILQRRALYDSLWFLTRARSAAKKGTHQKLSRHKWKKPENLTFIGIVTDAVERNPRENAETIPANRPIDLFIASADLLSRWSFSQFPLSHRKRKKKVRQFSFWSAKSSESVRRMFGWEPAVFFALGNQRWRTSRTRRILMNCAQNVNKWS